MITIAKLKSEIENKLIAINRHKINDKTHLYPSEITDCSKLIWYKLKHEAIDKNYKINYPEVDLLSVIGNAIHKYLQDNCSEFTIKEHSFVLKELLTSGRVDAMGYIRNGKNKIDNTILYEIKTCDSKTFNQLQKPLDKHLYQVFMYTIAFPHITEICFIYVNRDFKRYDSDIKQFTIKDIKKNAFIQNKIGEVKDKISYIKNCYINNEMPIKYIVKDYCNFCVYKRRCKNG